jgi:hypothetical protein
MTQAFVPLVPGALRVMESCAANTRLKPITPAATQPFQPGTPPSMKVESNGSPAAHVEHGEPKITMERQGDVVTHIRVQCGCGQVIELKCEY